MDNRFPSPGEVGYLEFVKTWKTVRLKNPSEMENPPNHEVYEKLLDQFDEFEQVIIRVNELNNAKDYMKCTCRPKVGRHANECKIHPYLKLVLINADDLEVAVESFLFVPLSFK